MVRHGEAEWLAKARHTLERRRRIVLDGLAAIPGLSCAEPHGAFYVFPSIEAHLGCVVAGRTIGSSLDLAELLLTGAQVAVIAGEAFGAPGHVRVSCALDDADLVDGINRIGRLLTGNPTWQTASRK